MYPHHNHQPFHNTIKTGAAISDSTHFEDKWPSCSSGGVTHPRQWRDRSIPISEDSHIPTSSHTTRVTRSRRSDAFRDRMREQSYHQTVAPRQAPPPPRTDSPCNSGDITFVSFVGSLTKDAFIEIVALNLDENAERNNDRVRLPTYSDPESVYFSVTRPAIPTKDYLRRLVTYTQSSPSAFVVMLIYMDRIARKNQRLLVTPYNMHRLLVTALTLACKMLDDRCFSNVHYAKVGGIPTTKEMNRLELQFLKYIDYSLHVNVDQYRAKLVSLENHPPPNSPVSINFENGTSQDLTASSSDRTQDEMQSWITVASGGTSTDATTFKSKIETSTSVGMEQWHSSRTRVPPPAPPPPQDKRIRKQKSAPPQLQNVSRSIP